MKFYHYIFVLFAALTMLSSCEIEDDKLEDYDIRKKFEQERKNPSDILVDLSIVFADYKIEMEGKVSKLGDSYEAGFVWNSSNYQSMEEPLLENCDGNITSGISPSTKTFSGITPEIYYRYVVVRAYYLDRRTGKCYYSSPKFVSVEDARYPSGIYSMGIAAEVINRKIQLYAELSFDGHSTHQVGFIWNKSMSLFIEDPTLNMCDGKVEGKTSGSILFREFSATTPSINDTKYVKVRAFYYDETRSRCLYSEPIVVEM